MMSNKKIYTVYVSSKNTKKSVYDDYKRKSKNGVIELRCPQSGEKLNVRFKNDRERKEWIELRNEIRRELRMVS